MTSEEGAFGLLDGRRPSDRGRWISLWDSWPGREVFAHPAFVDLFCRPGDVAACFSYEDSGGSALFPLVLRPLASEPWVQGALSQAWDATTPYGFGGPFCCGAPAAEGFWDAFDSWARTSGLVCLFARLALFEESLVPFRGEVSEKGPNVARSLGLPPDSLWMDYDHKVRKNVNRARRSGLVVEFDPGGNRLGDFLEIYYSTMERREAGEGYYFPESFFRQLLQNLPGQAVFFHAMKGETVVSTELVLVSAKHAYSFLGGTRKEAFADRPNDLLKHAIIEWGGTRGLKWFVFGGGFKPGDGIFKYKRSFAPEGVMPFRIGTRVFDAEAYGGLVEQRASASGGGWRQQTGFFPAYRG